MSGSKAWIAGCIGQRLNADERAFFADERPWGFILFGRNIGEPSQVRDLVAELKDVRGGDDVPILIDQEGGRVQRLRPPFAPRFPPAIEVGRVYLADEAAGRRAAWLQGRLSRTISWQDLASTPTASPASTCRHPGRTRSSATAPTATGRRSWRRSVAPRRRVLPPAACFR